MGQRAGLFWGWHRRPRHPDWGKGCLLPLLQAEDIGPDLWAIPEGWAVGVGGQGEELPLGTGWEAMAGRVRVSEGTLEAPGPQA